MGSPAGVLRPHSPVPHCKKKIPVPEEHGNVSVSLLGVVGLDRVLPTSLDVDGINL